MADGYVRGMLDFVCELLAFWEAGSGERGGQQQGESLVSVLESWRASARVELLRARCCDICVRIHVRCS